MDKNEAILRRILLNQAQIMTALMVVTKDRETNQHLNKMTSDTLDLLSDLK